MRRGNRASVGNFTCDGRGEAGVSRADNRKSSTFRELDARNEGSTATGFDGILITSEDAGMQMTADRIRGSSRRLQWSTGRITQR